MKCDTRLFDVRRYAFYWRGAEAALDVRAECVANEQKLRERKVEAVRAVGGALHEAPLPEEFTPSWGELAQSHAAAGSEMARRRWERLLRDTDMLESAIIAVAVAVAFIFGLCSTAGKVIEMRTCPQRARGTLQRRPASGYAVATSRLRCTRVFRILRRPTCARGGGASGSQMVAVQEANCELLANMKALEQGHREAAAAAAAARPTLSAAHRQVYADQPQQYAARYGDSSGSEEMKRLLELAALKHR